MTRKRPLTLTLRRRTTTTTTRRGAGGRGWSAAKWDYLLGGSVRRFLVNSDSMEAEEEPDLREYLVYTHKHTHTLYVKSYVILVNSGSMEAEEPALQEYLVVRVPGGKGAVA